MTARIARISRPLAWRNDFIRAHNYRCHYCNRFAGSVDIGPDGKPWHVDHMNPLAEGGEDVEENLTLACKRCNAVKHTLPYGNFRQYAKSALWAAEPKRIDDQDLNHLMTTFLRTSDGEWFYQTPADDSEPVRLYALERHELGIEADLPIAEISTASTTSRPQMGNADFIVLAHRLMPQLITEIHLLRAELAAARGEQDDTDLDTSVA